MRSFTVEERRARLARRHFLTQSAGSIERVVADLVALHATDPATPYLSLWARVAGFAVADTDAELYERRSLVKHLAMRRTLWTVRAMDLPLIQSCASDRVAENERRRLVADARKAGLTEDGDAWLDSACAAVLRHLGEHGAASAKEFAILLALGIPRWRISRMVLAQSAWVGVIGVTVAYPICLALQLAARQLNADVDLRWEVLAGTAGVTLLTALLSGLVALGSVRKIEPMDLLR